MKRATAIGIDNPIALWIPALVLLVLTLGVGCSNGPKPPQHMRILFTTDTEGYVTAVGGSDGPRGGMERRSTAIAEARKSAPGPVILIDTGNFTARSVSEPEKIESDLTAQAMSRIAYDAVNVGHIDAEHPRLELLKYNNPDEGLPLTSIAFTYDNSTTKAPESSYPSRIIVAPDNYRIGIIGHPLDDLDQSALGADNIFDPDPSDLPLALEDVSIKDSAQMLILVSDFAGSWQDTHFRASRYALASIVIAGESAPVNYMEEKHGEEVPHPLIVPRAMSWGRSLGVLDLDLSGQGGIIGYKLHYVDLNDKIEKDPSLADMTKNYIDAMNVNPKYSADALKAGYVGSMSCKTCHEKEYASWQASWHAKTWAGLEKSGRINEAICIPCHSTGYAGSPAFPSALVVEQYRDVGCESCHGPGQAHIDFREHKSPAATQSGQSTGGTGDSIILKPPESACIKCHQAPYDEGWMYNTKLNRVKHG